MENIPFIGADFIEAHTDFIELVAALRTEFAHQQTTVPMRHHHDFTNPDTTTPSTLLLMPAWKPGQDAGVKIVTVNPENHKYNLPSIQGSFIYFEAKTGQIKAIFDAKSLTAKRTAAASALAASYLALPKAKILLVVGTGALSANLVQAHASVRPIQEVFVWGRKFEKAQSVAKSFDPSNLSVQGISNIEAAIDKVDIISTATLSKSPLILGKSLVPGQHLDLVGSYKIDMREVDDSTISKAKLFVDTYEGALQESGDLVIPLQEGLIQKEDIQADLHELCAGLHPGRQQTEDITLFKSVGHASEDLAAAHYYYNKYIHAYNLSNYST